MYIYICNIYIYPPATRSPNLQSLEETPLDTPEPVDPYPMGGSAQPPVMWIITW